MSSWRRNLILCAVIALAAGGCASTRSAGEQTDDRVTAAKIEAKLVADSEINSFRIDVDVQGGMVRLSGVVEKESTRQEAERLARETKGVRDVVNEIVVGDPSLVRRAKDSAITAKVKSKLTADPEINPFNIDVDTLNGVVTLSGVVRTATAKAEAEKLARGTGGVVEVRNQLKVKHEE